jgi:hypothetical protein
MHYQIEEEPDMKREYIKPLLWGMAAGVVLCLIVIFSTGWVMTSGTANERIEQMAQKSVLDKLAPICVEQFMQDPNREILLTELKDLDYWKRGDYVKERGWATMPGSKTPDNDVAVECARRLVELEQ